MRIGIDARILSEKNYAGIGQYLYEIIDKWKTEYPENEYFLFSRREIFLKDDFPENWHIVNAPWIIDNRKLWYIFKLPQLIKDKEIEVFWGPNFSLPKKVRKVKYVVTVHDLAIYKFKGIGEIKNSILIKIFGKRDCRKADKVIAVSQTTAKDVKEIFGVSSQKIRVCYNGGVEKSSYKTDDLIVRDELKNERDYILFVSTIEPRKNVVRLIDGYERYREEYPERQTKLILAGKRGWRSNEVFRRIEESIYSNDIIVTGYVNLNEKRYLFENATCFVYPSLYEGFGIPILEAFSYGLPVITVRSSSLPEVGGEAALYLEENGDAGELAKLIEYVQTMSQSEKDELVKKMRKQSQLFSWEKCAKETMKVIREV